MPELQTEQREAEHGEKMIEVKIRFWTNDIASDEGMILPRHAWASGVVRIESNPSHGINPGKPRPFHSLLGMGSAIEEVLIDHGVQLHIPRRMQKYFQASCQTHAKEMSEAVEKNSRRRQRSEAGER